MKYMKKHGGIHTTKKGGMYDAIMKFMGGGNMEYMREGGKPDFLDLDKDGNKTESMKSAAASAKEMGKGGRMYRVGGVNEMGHGGGLQVILKAMRDGGMLNEMKHGGVHKYPHGGVHNDDSAPEIKIMTRDSFNTAETPQAGRDYIYIVNGDPQPNFQHSDVFNLLKAEGISKPKDRMQEIFAQLPPRDRSSGKEEVEFRAKQMERIMDDIKAIDEGERTKTVTPGEFSRSDLGALMKAVRRGDRAMADKFSVGRTPEESMRFAPTGQTGTPKNIDADAFLRALARNARN